MICSFIPGRVRFRSSQLKNQEIVSSIITLIKSETGVLQVENNLLTGSLLVHYNPEQISQKTVLEALDLLELAQTENVESKELPRGASPTHSGSLIGGQLAGIKLNKQALEYLFMIGALVVCTSSAFLRGRGLHVYSGLTLVGMTVQHLITYRHKLKNIILDKHNNKP